MNMCAKDSVKSGWRLGCGAELRGEHAELWDQEIRDGMGRDGGVCPPQLCHGLSAWPWAWPFTSLGLTPMD